MRKTILAGVLAASLPAAGAGVKHDLSGNVEAQGRYSWNNEEAKDFPLFQNWDEEEFYLVYGNVNGKLEFKDSVLEANWFLRHTNSELYDPDPLTGQNYLAPRFWSFPQRLVARDVFKLQHQNEGEDYVTESVLNKLTYAWEYGEHRLVAGRMYVNYGLGEIFNPINPFNQPTGLTSISQVAQGNDGASLTFFMNDKHTLQFLLLGDKAYYGYDDGRISRTLWVHGEYQWSEDLQFDYVLGEDQNRQKLGGQVSHNFEDALAFFQLFYQTKYVDDSPSHDLLDLLLGYDEQLTSKWHLRVEAGYQRENKLLGTANFGERFLPTEYFVALANQYEIHPLVKLSGTVINDVETGFAYFIARSAFSLGNDTEADIFGYFPLAKGNDTDNVAQKLVTTDVGVALRKFF